MISKTPQFDKALDKYFASLVLDEKGGQWRTCRFSGEKFYVRLEDIQFYKRIRVPLPTLSPAERCRRRLANMDVHSLFKVPSAYSGELIIAAYPPQTPFKIYEHQVWFSDKWDPLGFGRNWDESKNFMSQFEKLRREVPRSNLMTDTTNINSDYTNTSTNLKNCYLTFDTLSGENLYYFECCDASKDCVDCESLWNCDTCYACQNLFNSYRCFFCEQSRDCLESYFLYDCRNCEHCFMSSNLRNKKYYFRNQQLSKEEYEKKLKEINLGDYNVLQRYIKEFKKIKSEALHKPDRNFRSVNSVGDYIENSKDCYWCNYVTECQNVNYTIGVLGYKDSYDVSGGGGGELCYELMTVSTRDNYNVHFSFQMDNCRNAEYSELCRNCHDIFGCIGLNNKSFCILNKQYDEDEYWKLVDKIKSTMLGSSEYGEFFPPKLVSVPYKISLAAGYPGFRDYENAGRYGYDISEIPLQESEVQSEIIKSTELPADIKDAPDDILGKTIFDEKNNKYFKMTSYELSFYRRYNLALPREHPLVRLQYFREIYDLRLKFYDRKCPRCGVDIKLTFNPDKYKNVYCESCYNNEVA